MISKIAYLNKIGAHVNPTPDANILKNSPATAPKKGILTHLGKHWPGYLAAGALGMAGIGYLRRKRQENAQQASLPA